MIEANGKAETLEVDRVILAIGIVANSEVSVWMRWGLSRTAAMLLLTVSVAPV